MENTTKFEFIQKFINIKEFDSLDNIQVMYFSSDLDTQSVKKYSATKKCFTEDFEHRVLFDFIYQINNSSSLHCKREKLDSIISLCDFAIIPHAYSLNGYKNINKVKTHLLSDKIILGVKNDMDKPGLILATNSEELSKDEIRGS
jgi:hypothetical protein